MDKKWKEKVKKNGRAHSFRKGLNGAGNSSSPMNLSQVHQSEPMEVSESSSAAAAGAASAASTSSSQYNDRTRSQAQQSPVSQKGQQHHNEAWAEFRKDGKHVKKWRGKRRHRNRSMHRNLGINLQFSQQGEGHSREEAQGSPRKKNCSQGNSSYDCETRCRTVDSAVGGVSDNRSDCPHSSVGSSGGRKKRRENGGHKRKRLHNSHHTSTSSGASGNAATASSSLEIPGFYFDPEKKQYFKIMSSNFVPKGDQHFVTNESIHKKETEAQRQKDVATFDSSSRDTLASSGVLRKVFQRPFHGSLTSMLCCYQRDGNSHGLEQALIVNSVRQLRQTGIQEVRHSLLGRQPVDNLVQMEASREHDQILCLWAMGNNFLHRLKLVNVLPTKPLSRELSVKFTSTPGGGEIDSWNKFSSLCWAEFPQHPGQKFVLYSYTCPLGLSSSLVFIKCLEEETPAGLQNLNYNLGRQMVWSCAWNCHQHLIGVGTYRACDVIDAKTRQNQKYNTLQSDVLSLAFSKEHGGNLMWTGTRRGNILQFDLRNWGTNPIRREGNAMTHRSSVCCLRLSPQETYLYSSDFLGGIKKWDLRMGKEVLTYNGLVNQHHCLPFHIDETQSVLYAAGQDCYTKLWCLETGKLLLTVPPPEEASLDAIPAVRFAADWGKRPGNMGLIIGGREHFYMYSLQDNRE